MTVRGTLTKKGLKKNLTNESVKNWMFPFILTLILILLTLLKISGSSMGVYYPFFYGDKNDPALLSGEPRTIRSDEWVVNTQITISQESNDFKEVNDNLGDGAVASIVIDAPFDGFFGIFRAHNWSFFALPFEYAFALKWWIMGYFLILSVYLFCLLLLPNRQVLASIISLSVFFSPLVQWWYQYITLAPIYYTLFSVSIFILLTRVQSTSSKIILTLALSYTLTSFALVQYPAFQIPCIIVLATFSIGYIIDLYRQKKHNVIKEYLGYSFIAAAVAIFITGLFLYKNIEPVQAIANTVYPGSRNIQSGGYGETHFFANHLSGFFQSDTRAAHYNIPESKAINQSESSNFIYLFYILLIPLLYTLVTLYKKNGYISFTTLASLLCAGVLWAWLTIPGLDAVGKILLLNQVPHPRLLMGFGLLNIIVIILFIQLYSKIKTITKFSSAIYSLVVYLFLTLVAVKIHHMFPEFIGIKWSLVIGMPLAVSAYLLLQKKFVHGLTLFLIFSIASTWQIHPIYRGAEILYGNPLLTEMRSVHHDSDARWVMEDAYLQSFALMAGKPTLTGIYTYPQTQLWEDIEKNSDPYNRYAHVNFVIDRDEQRIVPTHISQPTSDRFGVVTEACSDFMRENRVRYIVTSGKISPTDAPCSQLISRVSFPQLTVQIYQLNF